MIFQKKNYSNLCTTLHTSMWMRKGIFNFVAFIARCPVIPISFRFDEISFFVESCFASETSRRHPSHINDIDNIFTSLSPFIDLTAKQKKLSSKNNFHVNVARRKPRGERLVHWSPIIPHRNEFYELFSMMYYSDENEGRMWVGLLFNRFHRC